LASSSDATRARFFLTLAVVCAAWAQQAGARVLVTQEKALAEAFPGASITRKDAFLTDGQAKRVEELSGTAPSSRVVAYYVAAKDGKTAGTAYFDTHLVRTLPETVMIVVDSVGAVAKVEVLSFEEPPEYLPKPKWFEQFKVRKLDKDLAPGRGIPVVTGATLTSRAVAAAVRRALALHAVLAVGTP
jgi:Na+-translocating ferredoxin:NAD+ oxidoreductase RnfG subunit